MPKGQQVLSD